MSVTPEAEAARLVVSTRDALRACVQKFVGTDNYEGARDALREELERHLAIYHGVGLCLQVSTVRVEVSRDGRGLDVTFWDAAGNRVRL